MKAEVLLCSNIMIPAPLPQMLLAYYARQDVRNPNEIHRKIAPESTSNRMRMYFRVSGLGVRYCLLIYIIIRNF